MAYARRVRYVPQEHSTGCGIACVAGVCRQPYQKVLDQYLTIRKARTCFYTKKEHVRTLLDRFGVEYGEWIDLRSGEPLPTATAIVAIDRWMDDRAIRNWHWIVYDGQRKCFYDPETDRLIERPYRKLRFCLPVFPGSTKTERE